MAGSRPRLLTRLPSLAGSISRPRLVDAVGTVPVVVLAAPAGSGATTLAAQLAMSSSDAATAWCRLAHGFDRLTDVVAAAAEATGVDLEPAAHPVAAAEQLLDVFDAGPTTLVVDDHHLGANADLDRVIAECVDLLPTGCRIIVAGITRPAALIGLVPPQHLRVLDADDLAFTAAEATELFALHGAPPERAPVWVDAVGGWAQAVCAGAFAPDSDPADHLDALLARIADEPEGEAVLARAAALPYVSADLLGDLGVTPQRLGDLVASSPLLVDHDGQVRLTDDAAARHRSRLDAELLAGLRRDAGDVLRDTDPVTAIEVYLDAGDHDAAADVLADHLSEIGVERALAWLYRLPAELRRRFPPVLAAGQATVEVDTALATAQLRVDTADNDRSRREALLALGSIEAHRGELAAAATALEAARRSARDDDVARGRISFELARTRFLLGDVIGARAALADSPTDTATAFLATQLDLVDDDADVAPLDEVVGDDAVADATRALRALAHDRLDDALAHSGRAYAAAVDGGGDPLVAAAPVRAVALLRSGDADGADVVVDELERRLGPRHRLSRVYGAILAERISRGGTDRGRHERDERRLRDHRQAGYATIEREIDALLARGDARAADADATTLVVRVLGEHVVDVDGRTVRRSEWKSKKALEVLTVLAARSPRGARREALIEDVWPGRDPEKGRTLLRTALSEIRRMLEPGRPTGEPSSYVTAADDIIRLDGRLDLDLADDAVADDPAAAFARLRAGLAPEVETAEWAQDWTPRVERLLVSAASSLGDDVDATVRVDALEALIAAEPWKRDHYDTLVELHRRAGDEAAAADVERRWFADD